MKATAVGDVRETLAAWAAENFHPTVADMELRIDAEVLLSEVTVSAVKELDRLGPFGHENPLPRFVASRIELAEPPKTMGEGDRHLAIKVRQHGTTMRGVAFGRGEWAEELQATTGPISITFAPVINTFRGFNKVELHLIDWKSSAAAQPTGG